MENPQEDVLLSYKLEIEGLKKQRDLFAMQVNEIIERRLEQYHAIVTPKLFLE